MNPALGVIFPVAARAIGVLASIVGVFAVRATDKDKSAMAPINRGFLTAGILTVIGTAIVAFGYVGNDKADAGWKCFGAVVVGLILAQGLSRLTEYFTSTETAPVREIAEASRTGPATVVLSGISSGLESSVYAIIAICAALGVAIAMGDGNIQFTFYLVALTGMGMLATTGVVVSEDTFGPVADNAAGIAEMSGEFEGEPERIMVSLDAVGNTTKAVTKGFAIGSAVIASVALFASFVETAGSELGLLGPDGPPLLSATGLVQRCGVADQRGHPKVFIGLLIGGSVAFLFSALAIRAVGRTAGVVVQEVRSQFADGGIMAGHQEARLRTGDRHLHRGVAARAGHPGAARGAHARHRRLRHQLLRARRVPRRRHPHRSAHGQLPEQLRWCVGQREEVHRGRQRGRQGLGSPQRRRHR